MGPGVLVDRSRRLTLQRVVADHGRGADGLLDIPLFEVTACEHPVRPHAGEAVGLQLEAHRQLVGLIRVALLLLVHLVADADEVLHVMSHLVGDDVGLSEVTWCAEAGRQLAEEVEVEPSRHVDRAVEGAHPRVGEPAPGLGLAGVEHEVGGLILVAELLLPGRLHVVEDIGHEVDELGIGVGRTVQPRSRRGRLVHGVEAARVEGATAAQDRLPAEDHREQGDDDPQRPAALPQGADAADDRAEAPETSGARRRLAALVPHVLPRRPTAPLHVETLMPSLGAGNTHTRVAHVAAVTVVVAVVTRQQAKTSSKPKSSRAAPPPRPGWREAIAGHEGDLAGLACLVLAVLAGLGIYADWSGVVGQALREGIGLLVGWVRLAVPIALACVGIALIRGKAPEERLRLGLGFALLAVSATGLLQLALGPDTWGAPLDEFRDAGGFVGAGIALPLERVLATAGATLVLIGIGLAGILILTKATLQMIATRAADGVRPVHAAARRVVGSVSTLSGERFGTSAIAATDAVINVRDASSDEPVSLIYDVDGEDEATDSEELDDDQDDGESPLDVDIDDEADIEADGGEEPVAEQLEIALGPAARRADGSCPR